MQATPDDPSPWRELRRWLERPVRLTAPWLTTPDGGRSVVVQIGGWRRPAAVLAVAVPVALMVVGLPLALVSAHLAERPAAEGRGTFGVELGAVL